MKENLDIFKHNLIKKFFGEPKGKNTCVICHNIVTKFRDDLSKKEYNISGMCQNCQDSVFGE